MGCVSVPSTERLVLDQEQRLIADQIISVFENDTPRIQYSYAEDLDDGRGITAGRAGFTSATGDMLEVIERYTGIRPDNPLAKYLPRLEELAETEDGSTEGLDGLIEAWGLAAEDEAFRTVQDEVVDEEYYGPATVHGEILGISWPLTLLNLYDAVIQHGDGDDPDGLPAMISRTNAAVGGSPMTGIDEGVWLQEFMAVRRSVLLSPDNADTQEEWSESVGRVDTLIDLYRTGDLQLTTPVGINPWGNETDHIIPAEYE